ncbi:hypothetical protein B0G76_1320 [Paraburkholderia sp. BL23I1N1]|uniref:hypothetical protein n=1 Tax=Paraburkholderia sp. BL23I1N1 TaxID=1938802 RepID=UPI000FF15574|nr:hypothetical protein [Paraburkholderia sp. BL23I1N1]RKE35259.1 hypothetical protein B0G76_1320 [Paraburkholderia sp. BL23I1N1]
MLTDVLNALLRAVVIALMFCAFFPPRARWWVRFTLSFGGALAGALVHMFWGHS